MPTQARPKLLIADEVGHLTLETTHASLLFRAICERSEKQQTIVLTNNKAFLDWVGHRSDAMIKHYTAKCQFNNAGEMAKLQPVIRMQSNDSNGNEVALFEPEGTEPKRKEVGAKAA